MTAIAMLPTLRAFGFDTDRAEPWTARALCHGRWDEFEALLSNTAADSPNTPQARSAHLCIAHCTALVKCTEQTERPGMRPIETVQAGLWWPVNTSRPPKALPDPGCGPHCADLRRQR